MEILAIYNKETRQLRRLAGPMPINPADHVQAGEDYIVVDTTTPKHPHEIQAEICAAAGPLITEVAQ